MALQITQIGAIEGQTREQIKKLDQYKIPLELRSLLKSIHFLE